MTSPAQGLGCLRQSRHVGPGGPRIAGLVAALSGGFPGLAPGYIKRADVAWYASHHHTPDGLNEPYQYSYLFAYAIDLPANARTLTLPDNANIRVLAVSVAEGNPEVKPAQPLYDTLTKSSK